MTVRRAVVVGAGFVGLSCAWSLQEAGVEVTVLDRARPGAGASWQNAGYLSPAMCVPLPEPSVLRYGLRALISAESPVSVLRMPDARLVAFLVSLARACTRARWTTAMDAYRDLNDLALCAYDAQLARGVAGEVRAADVVCAATRPGDLAGVVHELSGVRASGQVVEAQELDGDAARALEPHLSRAVRAALVIRGQRYLTPSAYLGALVRSVRGRGGEIVEGAPVREVTRRGGAVVARGPEGTWPADAVVLASGAWLGPLARPHGVEVRVYGGRGYSFTVAAHERFRCPLYFPSARVATAPQGDRLRVTGVMEFGAPDAPARRGRPRLMARSVAPLLDGVDWSTQRDEWMGPRPLSADGLPLVGATRTPGVFVAGGHGMWGVTLGPLTGALLARQIVRGVAPPELLPLDPTR